MSNAFVNLLREAAELALVASIACAFLRKIDRPSYGRTLWIALALGTVLSIGAAVAAKAIDFDMDGAIEGGVLAIGAFSSAWFVLWMWRQRKEPARPLPSSPASLPVHLGLLVLGSSAVLRSGPDSLLLLMPADLTTASMLSTAGGVAGLCMGLAAAYALSQAISRVRLGTFLPIALAALLLYSVQLLVSSIHEFAEAGLVPSSEATMRLVGPFMKHCALFVMVLLALPFLLVFRSASAPLPSGNEALARKSRAMLRTERFAKGVFSTLAAATILILSVAYAHESKELVLSQPEIVFEEAPEITVPVALVEDGKLHRFAVRTSGKVLRFLVLRPDEKKDAYATAMDACTICNDWGYVQIGERILCRNCVAEINPSTLGEGGGCNPIPVKHERRAGELVVKLESLTAHAAFFKNGQRVSVRCAVCAMEVDVERAGRLNGKWYCDMPGLPCRKELQGRP